MLVKKHLSLIKEATQIYHHYHFQIVLNMKDLSILCLNEIKEMYV